MNVVDLLDDFVDEFVSYIFDVFFSDLIVCFSGKTLRF